MTSVWREPRLHGRRKARGALPRRSPVLPYPIDRRLRLCALVGTQHFFLVVVRRRSCMVPGVGGAATCGGARRAGAVRAACSAACVRVALSCGCGLCGSACGLRLLGCRVCGAQRGRGGCMRARAGCRGGGVGGSCCPSWEWDVVLLRERRACASPVPVLEMSLMPPQVVGAVAAAKSPCAR